MDVKRFALDGEWLEIMVESDRLTEPFKFFVQPIGSTGFMAASKSLDEITTLCVRAVIGWELTDGDAPLPCDEKNKLFYLNRFATYMVKAVNGKSPEWKQEAVIAKAIAKASAETDPEARAKADLIIAREQSKLRGANLASVIVDFASNPDNFLKN